MAQCENEKKQINQLIHDIYSKLSLDASALLTSSIKGRQMTETEKFKYPGRR